MTKETYRPQKGFYIFGSNTDVGKTLLSAYLSLELERQGKSVQYLKIVQSGFPNDDDAALVRTVSPSTQSSSLVRLPEPLSPHRCTGRDAPDCSNQKILEGIVNWLESTAGNGSWRLLEPAGGVLSPMPQGDPSAEVLRPLRLPVILVGDPRLGGISQTLSAWESLRIKGYDVPFIIFFRGEHENAAWLKERLIHSETRVHEINLALPERSKNLIGRTEESALLQKHYDSDPQTAASLKKFIEALESSVQSKADAHENMQRTADAHFWWPFTQHKGHAAAQVIESAYGGDLNLSSLEDGFSKITRSFDASCSWWTLGIGHGHPSATVETASALGRYGHVLFPGNTHEPVTNLAKRLIDGVGQGWADRVFFSDNGSTAVEVALKMAFRLAEKRGLLSDAEQPRVVGFAESYHGDTLGAVNATNPNAFKERDRWYTPKGVWLTPQSILYTAGRWSLQPTGKRLSFARTFQSLAEIFDVRGRKEHDSELYKSYRNEATELLDGERSVSALLIEPVIHGAGGMIFVDPLCQRALCDIAKERGIPIIFDEVFSGFHRFGVDTASKLLDFKPDIACFSKTLTGGLIPTAVTLASHEVFQSFNSDTKREALLHGHSYTAHPAGCAAAVESLKIYERLLGASTDRTDGFYWPWNLVNELGELPHVEGLVSIGTLLAIRLKSESAGYLSNDATRFLKSLHEQGISARPLGNVIYLMCHPLEERDKLCQIAKKLYFAIKETGSS